MSSPKVIVNSTPVVKVNYGLPGVGVPKGGTRPQVLKKVSGTDYDTEWGDAEILVLNRGDLRFGGTPISKGDPVYLLGTDLRACDASVSSTLPPIGVVAADVSSPTDDVDVIVAGGLYNMDTSGFSLGDRLYVGVGGGLTATEPSGSNGSFYVGVVTKVDASEGIVSVDMSVVDGNNLNLAHNKVWIGNISGVATPTDHELKRLIDVDSFLNPSANEVLRYSGAQWEAVSLGFDDIPLSQLSEGHVYAGNSSNETTTTDTIYVDIANSRVGIGTTTPQEALHVDGRINLDSGSASTLIGTLLPSTHGSGVVGIGNGVLRYSTSASYTTAVGYSAASRQDGTRNVAVGHWSMLGAVGASGSYNVAVGAQSLYPLDGGDYNVALGTWSGVNVSDGNRNTLLGHSTGHQLTTENDSVMVGYQAGLRSKGSSNVLIGSGSGQGVTSQSTFENTVAVGHQSLTALTTGASNTAIGYEALHDLTTGSRNTALGYQAGDSLTTGISNTLVGESAGEALTTQGNNTLIGQGTIGAGSSTAVGSGADAGSFSVSIGQEANSEADSVGIGYLADSGDDSISIGNNSRAGASAVSIGTSSGRYNQGQHNVAIGFEAGLGQNTISGSNYNYNVFVGYQAGAAMEDGSGNVLIGYRAGVDIENENHKLHITGQAQILSQTPLIYGEFDNEFVKINGDLEVRDEIVSSGGADIVLNPNGAGNVVMGNYEFDVDQAVGAGTDNYVLTYDDATGEISLKENIQEIEGATEVTFAIRNDEGAPIAAGTPLYSKGEIGSSERIRVGVADASDPAKMPSIGIAKEALADQADGDAMIMGTFNTNLTGYTGADENQVLYVAAGGGLPTNVKPTGSGNLIQNVGIVLKANGAGTNVQSFKVSCIGRTNDVPNLATGNIWAGNSSGVAQSTSTAYIDIANSRVGIGTTSPSQSLDVSDTISVGTGSVADGRLILKSSGGPTVQFTGTGAIDTTTGGASAGLRFTDTAGNAGKQRYLAFSPGTAGLVTIDRSAHATNRGGLIVQQQNGLGTNGNEIFVTANSGSSVIQSRGFGGTGLGADVAFKIGGNSNNASDTETEVMRITNASALSPYSVGIGTSTPDEKLHVAGQLKIDDGANPYTFPAADGQPNYILETDGSGTVSWVANSGGGISAVVDDLTPQLGGDLDVYDGTTTHQITTSSTNGDIVILPNGTGTVFLGNYEFDVSQSIGASVNDYVLTFDDTTKKIQLEPPALSTTGTNLSKQVVYFDSSGVITSEAGFEYDPSTNILTVDKAYVGELTRRLPSTTSAGAFGANSEVITKLGTNVNVTAGKVYCMNGGAFVLSDADAEATSKGLLAVASATGTTNGTPMVLRGMVRLDTNSAFSGAAVGDPLYLRQSAGVTANEGQLTSTPPSGTGNIVRIVGYVQNPTSGVVYFNPDSTFIEV
jgi:hypothetical protein